MEPCGLSGVVEEVPEGLQVFVRRSDRNRVRGGFRSSPGVWSSSLFLGWTAGSPGDVSELLRRSRNRDSGGVSAVGTGSSC